ncbi:hypothetical protein [Arcticibacterium luteifluviistationis]|uniref:Uncharacterized protein n=1 Tax=Arcticibacterium luteifluviistationis TaxID=1784714 RepID=A0A2Z4GAA3_9BACT|nr:hypothetical protein [Arcticibacterium luteifluviistationis]AWV98136.1 hypothetical protein DJ013_08105 [Arcticibacterium luteifluviistationis]
MYTGIRYHMRVFTSIILLTALSFQGKAQSTSTDAKAQNNEAQNNEIVNQQIQISKTVDDPNCQTDYGNEVNVVNTVIKGASEGCLEIKATDYIDLGEFFDSEYGSTFDAQIVSEIPGTDPVDPGTDPVDPTPDTEKQCEDFSNHGPSNPHLYAQSSSNSFVGDLVAKYTPEYKIEGLTDWKLLTTAGSVIPGSDKKYHYYKEPFDGWERNTLLRTKAGCPEYRDVRSQKVYTNTLEEWHGLPTSMPSINPSIKDYYIMVNSELEGRPLWNDIPVYNLYADRDIPNLNVRVNWNDFYSFEKYTYPLFQVRPNRDMMITTSFNVKKDFIIDVSDDGYQTASRYTVYRNYQGGHWSTATTLTRHDGRVTVSVQGINWDTDQLLVNVSTGQTYYNIQQFGNVFDLGYLPDGDYQFAVKTYHGHTINDRVIVKVKRPSIN